MQNADSLEKTLMLGNIEGRKRNGWQRMRWLHPWLMNMSLNKLIVKDRKVWFTAVYGVTVEKAMATHSSTLTWKIPWMEPGCSSWGSYESHRTEWLHFHFSFSCIGEGHGNRLQCSCLENPRDGGAWWAAVAARGQIRQTRLKNFGLYLRATGGHWKLEMGRIRFTYKDHLKSTTFYSACNKCSNNCPRAPEVILALVSDLK